LNSRPLDPQSSTLTKLRYTPEYIFAHKKKKMVGVAGLEPAAFASRTQHSTKLSHTPMKTIILLFSKNVNIHIGLLEGKLKKDPDMVETTNVRALGEVMNLFHLPICLTFSWFRRKFAG
jgi:hypothetical protein